MEVTGAVNLAEKFPTELPPEADQDAFIKDACTRMTDAYLAPVQLRSTTLTLIYSTISLPSWSAGSHQVSCSIGATLGNGGWSTLLNGAKGPLMINGQPPIAPPDIPEDRLNLPPIPVIEPQMPDTSSQYTSPQTTDQGQQTQHMPGQQSTGTTSTSAAPTSAPPPGNTFLNGAPPPGAPQDGPPPPDGAPLGPGVPPGPAAPLGPGAPPGPAAPLGPDAPPGPAAPLPPPEAAPAPPPPPGEPLPPPPLPGQ
jgi:hypothetical protein